MIPIRTAVNRLGLAFRDCVLFLVGHRCIVLGEWPDRGLGEAAMGAITDLGGQRVEGREFALAFDIENLYFRVQGCRVRLCIEEYGEVTLWGPKRVVTDIAKRIRDRQAPAEHA